MKIGLNSLKTNHLKFSTMNPNNLTKEYTNGEVTIVWQSGKCIHSAIV